MGLFDFIGSIGSSIVSGISKIASSIAPAVTSFAKTAFNTAVSVFTTLSASSGGFIGKVASVAKNLFSGVSTIIAGPLGPIVGQVVSNLIIAAVSKVVEWISQKNKIIEPEDTVEEVGYRVREAANHEEWQKREEFDSFAAYHNYLKGKIPTAAIDREKIELNRLTYMGLGLTALTEGLESEFGLKIPIEFLIEIGRSKLSGMELNSLLEEFSAKGYDLSLFRSYLQGRLDINTAQLIENMVFEALKKVYPEKSNVELNTQISAMKEASRDDVQVLKNYENEVEDVTKGNNDKVEIILDGVGKNDSVVKG